MPGICRLFQESDLETCTGLFVETFAGEPWNETWHPETVRARLLQILLTPGFVGAVSLSADGGITGFVLGFLEPWHEGSHFYLKEMCVHARCQRQGIGTRLLAFLKKELQARGATRIYLLTARGDLSEAFYSACGFYTSPKMILMVQRFAPPAEPVPESTAQAPAT